MKKKMYVLILILMLFVTNSSLASIAKESIQDNVIYVDDDNIEGPWDGSIEHPYQFIQDGIDIAIDEDTIFVYNGTYYEHITVDVSILLIGENKETTSVISPGNPDVGSVINIIKDRVTIKNFTILYSPYKKEYGEGGLNINSKNNIITNNIIKPINTSYLSSYDYGVRLFQNENNLISNNIIKSNGEAISFSSSNNITITYNTIQSFYGSWLENVTNSYFNFNNFFRAPLSLKSITFINSYNNTWYGNYWNRPRILPKPIRGLYFIYLEPIRFLIDFDWHPAKKPYDIDSIK